MIFVHDIDELAHLGGLCNYTSMSAWSACSMMYVLRVGISSPISVEVSLLASRPSSIVICFNLRVAGFMVVSHNCVAFISPTLNLSFLIELTISSLRFVKPSTCLTFPNAYQYHPYSPTKEIVDTGTFMSPTRLTSP